MKFFKCHSQKMKDDKFICVQDKFTDIGPDVFEGFKAEYIVFGDGTKIIRNYAFSGLGKCNIYLPKAIEEIEPYAFDNIDPETTFYCAKGSYAEQICIEYNLIINYDVNRLFALIDEQKRIVAEQKKLLEDQKRLVEEQKRLVEEQKRLIEEQKRKEEEARLAEEARLENERIAAEEQARREEEQKELERIQNEEAERVDNSIEIKVFVLDDVKGRSSYTEKFCNLAEKGREMVQNNELYIHCRYDGDKPTHCFVTKEEYIKLYTESAVGNNVEKTQTEKYYGDVTVNILDENNCEKKRVLSLEDIPQAAREHIVDGVMNICKTIVDGNVVSNFVSKTEYLKAKLEQKVSEKQKFNVAHGEILIHILDENGGEKTQVLPRVDLPATAHKHIVDNEMFIHKSKVDGSINSVFVTKEEYINLKKSISQQSKPLQCPFCGINISSDDVFCANCGKKVADVKRCNQCGGINYADDSFCASCGNRLD